MCTQDSLYLSQLLGKTMSEDFVTAINYKLHKQSITAFEITNVALSIIGTKPEDAFLFAEIIVKGDEFSPIELHMPLNTCKSSYLVNKNAISIPPDSALPILRDFFQEVANEFSFGDEIDV